MRSLSQLVEAWDPERDLTLAVLLALVSVGYVLYHFGARALHERGPGTVQAVVGGRLLGAIALGVPSLLWAGLAAPELLDVWRPPTGAALGLGAGLALLLLPILWLAAGGKAHRAHYPQIRAARWTPGLTALEAGSWAVYLIAYEWCFRGLLICGLAEAIGLWPALLAGTALYVLAHLGKGLGECLACVPMGLLFGVLAWGSRSLWPPILLHLCLALAGNLFAVARDPGRSFGAPTQAGGEIFAPIPKPS
ncbi:MAG: CPBP family intramembrane metalloprotease [Planctomycetes bacterium]|nr:CPBP family intramembrane metalloprotease [Planctomycetota bacterium]